MASKVRVLIEVRSSDVHGRGVFARRRIPKGMRIIEYTGDRITHAEADRRYEDHEESDNHTFLFSVDRGLVIDAGVGGNDARFINHSCDPNCESVIERRHVFIDAVRDIAAGEELAYDYQIGRERNDPPNVDEIYACRCGAARCRGTMLWPPRRTAPRKGKSKRKTKRKTKRKSANDGVTAQGRGGTPPRRSRASQKGNTGGARKRAARRGRSR